MSRRDQAKSNPAPCRRLCWLTRLACSPQSKPTAPATDQTTTDCERDIRSKSVFYQLHSAPKTDGRLDSKT
jgi:hypothetical protein